MAKPSMRQGDDRVPVVLLAEREAAHYLTIGNRTLKALRASGAIPAVRVSTRRIAYRVADLDAYIASKRPQ